MRSNASTIRPPSQFGPREDPVNIQVASEADSDHETQQGPEIPAHEISAPIASPESKIAGAEANSEAIEEIKEGPEPRCQNTGSVYRSDFDPTRPVEIHTDVTHRSETDMVMCAVLSQQADGPNRIVRYAVRNLTTAEQKDSGIKNVSQLCGLWRYSRSICDEEWL